MRTGPSLDTTVHMVYIHCMDTREMIALLKQEVHRRAEMLLSQEEYSRAAEAVSVLEALTKAERLLTETPIGATVSASTLVASEESSRLSQTQDSQPEYPHFLRAHQELVKVGWSSKNEAEYQHRAPRASVSAICDAVERAASGYTPFSRQDLDGRMSSDGEDIPDYQVYVCLSWLRWAGLLNRVQRGKYSVPNLRRFSKLWKAAWDQLPLETPQAE